MNSPSIKKRDLKTARKLTFYLPGLGHLYCGDFTKAILLILGTIIATALCIIAWALDPPRTLFYLFFLLALHFAGAIWSYLDIKKVVLRTREDYRLKDYNKPWIYAFFYLTYILCIVPIAVFSTQTFVSIPFLMNSDDGGPTVKEGERVLASKIAYRMSSPQTGDLIVFRSSFTEKTRSIRRIVAKGGDSIEIINNQVLINGKPENGDYPTIQTRPLKDFPKITLSPNELFVLADNRDSLNDSRHNGPISVFSVAGKVNFKCWPLSKFGSLE